MDENGSENVSSCRHELLDAEAHKFSNLILAVQKRYSEGGDRVGADLFAWAEQFEQSGRSPEAEFLYLHAIGWCERLCGAVYPTIFHGLRDYALNLLARLQEQQKASPEPARVSETFVSAVATVPIELGDQTAA